MGVKWESVVFECAGISPVEVATSLSELTSTFAPTPKVMVHFMYSAPGCESADLLSCELTSFRKKPVLLKNGAASEVDRRVFEDTGLHFKTPEVLVARHISRVFGRTTLYVHYNDASGSFGYVLFSDGEIAQYHIANWEGIDLIRSSQGDVAAPLMRLVRDAFPQLNLRSVEELFDCFYSDESKVETFLLAEKGEAVRPVRRLYEVA